MRVRPLRWLLARSDQAGVFAASAIVAGTFQRTLMPRSDRDQAVVTGLSVGLSYLVASLVQDVVETTSSWVLSGARAESQPDERQLRRATLAFGAAGAIAGLRSASDAASTTGRAAPPRRCPYCWLVGNNGLSLRPGDRALAGNLCGDRSRDRRGLQPQGIAVPLSSVAPSSRQFGACSSERIERQYADAEELEEMGVSALRALPMGVGAAGALTGFVLVNRTASAFLGRALESNPSRRRTALAPSGPHRHARCHWRRSLQSTCSHQPEY